MVKKRRRIYLAIFIALLAASISIFSIFRAKEQSYYEAVDTYRKTGEFEQRVDYNFIWLLLRDFNVDDLSPNVSTIDVVGFLKAFYQRSPSHVRYKMTRALVWRIRVGALTASSRELCYLVMAELSHSSEYVVLHIHAGAADPDPEVAAIYFTILINQDILTEEYEIDLRARKDAVHQAAEKLELQPLLEWFRLESQYNTERSEYID